MTDTTTHECLNCDRPETAVPLVAIRYDGQEGWICSLCMPVLIHNPERLMGRLARAESIPAAPHQHEH
jgi:hypothetical protein